MTDTASQIPDPAPDVAAAAARALSDALGGRVRLSAGERLGGSRSRSGVWRFVVADGPRGAPARVIAKRFAGDATRFDPDAQGMETDAGRFRAEWAAHLFLDRLGADPPLSPRLQAADPRAGVLVMEDVGEGPSLADRLTGDDAGAAVRAMERYAAGMGRLHAATLGRRAELEAARASIGAGETWTDRDVCPGIWEAECLAPFLAVCERLEVGPAPGFEAEARAAADAVRADAPVAFSPGDTCPDNHRRGADGHLRFFDFEFCGFRHPLLDAAYFRVPFPTCWCVGRAPDPVAPRLDAAYRAALSSAWPQAADDAWYRRQMARALGFWLLETLTFLPGEGMHLAAALERDRPWGLAGTRERHLLRLDTFAETAEGWSELPAMAETARTLAARLRALWPETGVPRYPPFREDASAR